MPRRYAAAHRSELTTIPAPARFEFRTQASLAEVASGHPHRREHASRDLGQGGATGLFQKSDRLLASDTRKVLEKDLEAVTTLDVVEQRSDRDTSPDEDRVTAMNVRVRVDN